MRLLLSILLGVSVVAADPHGLGKLVDEADPKARRAAAGERATSPDAELAQLLEACREFRPHPLHGSQRGVERHSVELRVGDATERTRITTYVPQRYRPSEPHPLLLYLHGSGGNGDEAIGLWRAHAEKLGMVIVAPTEAGKNGGYGFTPRERIAALAALRWARRTYNVDENRIHLTGVSRGGHMTWDLGTRHPDRWASLSPMIGGPRWLPQRGQNNLRFVENIAALPMRDLQGVNDHPGLLVNLRFAFARLKQLKAPDARFVTFDDLGHSFRMESVDWDEFLARAKRTPVPVRVVRLSAGAEQERRASWIEILKFHRDTKEQFTPRVDGRRWGGLDEMGQRAMMDGLVAKRTSRIEARMVKKGEFLVKSERVRKFRILLTAGMFDPEQPVVVTWNGRKRRVKAKATPRILLEEFADRFDRTFLPIAEVRVP